MNTILFEIFALLFLLVCVFARYPNSKAVLFGAVIGAYIFGWGLLSYQVSKMLWAAACDSTTSDCTYSFVDIPSEVQSGDVLFLSILHSYNLGFGWLIWVAVVIFMRSLGSTISRIKSETKT